MENVPFVIKNVLSQWPASEWTPVKLSEMLNDKKLRFRIGKKKHTARKIQFETDCLYCTATMKQFLDWLDHGEAPEPFEKFSSRTHFAYLDYQYMFDLFDNDENILKSIDWNLIGLVRDGFESTFWMGTEGSYTPCHYDTYGFNLVAQLHGRKRWTLVSPDESRFMQPIRLPYEESSVFANVNLLKPSSSLLHEIHPRVIVLEPGDLLYVPRHWWHFVQCLTDGCISVNTWVETPNDKNAKLSEGITRCLVSLVKNNCMEELLDNEVDSKDSIACLNKLLIDHDDDEPCSNSSSSSTETDVCPTAKKRKLNIVNEPSSDDENFFQQFIADNEKLAKIVPNYSFQEFSAFMNDGEDHNSDDDDENIETDGKNFVTEKTLINALLHPDTIEQIKKVLLMKENKI